MMMLGPVISALHRGTRPRFRTIATASALTTPFAELESPRALGIDYGLARIGESRLKMFGSLTQERRAWTPAQAWASVWVGRAGR